METNTNPTGIEKSNQLVWSSDDLIKGSGHVRSYTCAFCKRGFSNAQALGGHMNIHRKDRAKLRQFAEESLLSLDISKTCSIENSDVSEEQSSTVIILESSEEKSCTPKRPCSTLFREDGDIEELQQITFFAETPSSSSGDIKASSCSTGTKDNHAEKKMQSGHSSSQIELDLELRLGPEPHETSNTSTKEFFRSSGNYTG